MALSNPNAFWPNQSWPNQSSAAVAVVHFIDAYVSISPANSHRIDAFVSTPVVARRIILSVMVNKSFSATLSEKGVILSIQVDKLIVRTMREG